MIGSTNGNPYEETYTILTYSIDVTTAPMGGTNIYTGEKNIQSDVQGAKAVIPLWARKSGYSYFCPMACESGVIRVQSTVSLTGVTAGVLVIR